jgi:hypothetical protein
MGGGEETIAEVGRLGTLRYWDLAGNGIYFVSAQPKPMLRFLDLETRRVRDVAARAAFAGLAWTLGGAGREVGPLCPVRHEPAGDRDRRSYTLG